MTRSSLVVHGHFYQPPRLDPFTGTMPVDPTAAPARDWNQRIADDCYRPNAQVGTDLEGRLAADRELLHGPGQVDGVTLLDAALAAVGERRS